MIGSSVTLDYAVSDGFTLATVTTGLLLPPTRTQHWNPSPQWRIISNSRKRLDAIAEAPAASVN